MGQKRRSWDLRNGPGVWRAAAVACLALLLMGQSGGITSSNLRVYGDNSDGDKAVIRVGSSEVFKISTDNGNTSVDIAPLGTGKVTISGAMLTDAEFNSAPTFSSLGLSGTLSVAGLSSLLGGALLGDDLSMDGNDIANAGTITALAFSGNGAGLTGIDAGNITSGALADGRLSSNIPRLDAANQFTHAAGPLLGDDASGTRGQLRLHDGVASSNYVGILFPSSTLSQTQLWEFPDQSGTVALLSDLGGLLPRDGSQAMTGALNMDGNSISNVGAASLTSLTVSGHSLLGTLTTTGTAILTGASMFGNLSMNFYDITDGGAASFTGLTTSGQATLGSFYAVGNSKVGNGPSQLANLDVWGKLSVLETLFAGGGATIQGNSSLGTLSTSGMATLHSFTANNNSSVGTGPATPANLTVWGNVIANGYLYTNSYMKALELQGAGANRYAQKYMYVNNTGNNILSFQINNNKVTSTSVVVATVGQYFGAPVRIRSALAGAGLITIVLEDVLPDSGYVEVSYIVVNP
jgi:hypothetical protein